MYAYTYPDLEASAYKIFFYMRNMCLALKYDNG